MGNIVNLRRAAKRRARYEARREADSNAALHGEAKRARHLREARAALEERRLEGHRRDGSRGPDDGEA